MGPLPVTFTESGTGATVLGVRLQGTRIDADSLRIDVVLTGPVSSTLDLYAFAFDMGLSDPSMVQLEPGTAVLGDALVLASGQGQAVLVSQNGDRIIVGVSKTNGGSGNGVAAGDHVILGFEVRVPSSGTALVTLLGSPQNPLNPTSSPAAIDSNGSPIAGITFDTAAATISR
jgi:hypothetical protein